MQLKEIRILHITNSLDYGGVEKIIYQLCEATSKSFEKCVVASSGGVYVDKLRDINVDHITIPDLSSKDPKAILSIYQILRRAVKKYNINIIHCHHRMAVPFARILLGKKRVIYNNHTIYSDKRRLSHLVLNGVNIIADGEKAKANITDFFCIEQQVTVINNAVDEFDNIVNEISEISASKSEGKFIVMNSSRLHPQKGLQYFIGAAEILVKKGLNIAFFIVGDGPLKDELKNRVKEKKLQSNIIFLGFRNDIKSTIRQCDVLVLSSIYEGLPLTPMEAFSVHKAVIGTDIDGTREVIMDGYNGLLADNKDAKSIADKIEFCYTHRDELEIMSQNAYEVYREKFSLPNFKKKYLEYYENFI